MSWLLHFTDRAVAQPEAARRDRGRRPRSQLLAALIVAAIGLLSLAGRAEAHAILLGSSPSNGEQVAESPASLRMTFSEPVSAVSVELYASSGTLIPVGGIEIEGSSVSVGLPELADSGYAASWKAISDDGHPISGTLVFAVGAGSTPPSPAIVGADASPTSWRAVSALARAMQYGGFLGVIGLLLFVAWCWPDGRTDRWVRQIAQTAAVISAFGAIARLLAQGPLASVGLRDVLATSSGRAWLASAVLGGVMAGLAPMLLAKGSVLGRTVAVIVLAEVGGLLIAEGGHGASGRVAMGGLLLTVVHVLAAACWVGGLLGAWRVLRAASQDDAHVALRKFSKIAFAAVVALFVTGPLLGWRQMRTWDAIPKSGFGQSLLIKLVALAILLVTAAVTNRTLRRGSFQVQQADGAFQAVPWPRVLRTTLAVELVAAGLVALATGVLAGSSPNTAPAAPDPIELTLTNGPDQVTVFIAPGQVGPNDIHINVNSGNGTNPDDVTLIMNPDDVSLAPVHTDALPVQLGHAVVNDFEIPFAGAWTIEVRTRYGDFKVASFTAKVDIAAAPAPAG